MPPLNSDEVRSLLPQAKGWGATDGDTKIAGEFKFKNFRQTLDFVIEAGEFAESEFHHPVSINSGWGFCAIVLQTKKIKGLHENDFIIATKINKIGTSRKSAEPKIFVSFTPESGHAVDGFLKFL